MSVGDDNREVMATDTGAFSRIRPWVYHLTATTNLVLIEHSRQILSASALIRRAGRSELSRRRRSGDERLRVDGHDVILRDQAPLHEGNLTLSGGWKFEDLVEALNGRVFFWPGTESGPNAHGRRHFGRYQTEHPVLIRVKTVDLLAANDRAIPEFCRYNSGSPRCSGGRRSPRGPETFVEASSFEGLPSKVVELVFREVAVLPDSWEISHSSDGPWSKRSQREDLPSNTASNRPVTRESGSSRTLNRRI
jgi:hypothetical protein